MKTNEHFVKVKIETSDDLPKESAWVIAKNKMLIPESIYFTWDDRKWWLDHIDWYLLPVEQIELPSDEEIINYFTKEHYHYQKGRFTRVDKDRIFGAKWAVEWIKKQMK